MPVEIIFSNNYLKYQAYVAELDTYLPYDHR